MDQCINILIVIAPTRSIHLSPLYRTPFCLVLQIYVVTRASAVDKTENRSFQPRRSPRKHSSDRECDNRAAARASSSSSFGANFDRSAFEHPSPDVDIESMPPASKPKVGSDAMTLRQCTTTLWSDAWPIVRALRRNLVEARRPQVAAPLVRDMNRPIPWKKCSGHIETAVPPRN